MILSSLPEEKSNISMIRSFFVFVRPAKKSGDIYKKISIIDFYEKICLAYPTLSIHFCQLSRILLVTCIKWPPVTIVGCLIYTQNRHKIKHIFKRDNSGYFFWSESKQWIPVINSVRTTMPLFVVYTFSMYRNKNKYQRIQFFLVYYEGQKEFLTLYHSAVSVSNWHTWILLNTYSIHTGI